MCVIHCSYPFSIGVCECLGFGIIIHCYMLHFPCLMVCTSSVMVMDLSIRDEIPYNIITMDKMVLIAIQDAGICSLGILYKPFKLPHPYS